MTHPAYRTADFEGFEDSSDPTKPTLLLLSTAFPSPATCSVT